MVQLQLLLLLCFYVLHVDITPITMEAGPPPSFVLNLV